MAGVKGMNKGNKNAVGNKGGARPTIHQEERNFQALKTLFKEVHNRDELLKKIESGEFSVEEAFLAKALSGNVINQNSMFNKYYPEKLIIDSYERSLDQETLEMSDDKYKGFIEREYRRLGLDKRIKNRRKK